MDGIIIIQLEVGHDENYADKKADA